MTSRLPVDILHEQGHSCRYSTRRHRCAVASCCRSGDTLFAYLPGPRIAFEADITDYVLSAKHFLQFVEGRGLKIDHLYGAHNSSSAELWHLEDDDPSN